MSGFHGHGLQETTAKPSTTPPNAPTQKSDLHIWNIHHAIISHHIPSAMVKTWANFPYLRMVMNLLIESYRRAMLGLPKHTNYRTDEHTAFVCNDPEVDTVEYGIFKDRYSHFLRTFEKCP
jgi:hypothetical protein